MRYFEALLEFKIRTAKVYLQKLITKSEELGNDVMRFEENIIKMKQSFRKYDN